MVSEPQSDRSSSKSAAASVDESAEERAKSSGAARESDAATDPATPRSEDTAASDASSSSSDSDASFAPSAGDEDGLSGSPEPEAVYKGVPRAAATEADGSPAVETSGESSEEGGASEPGTAATAKVQCSRVVETFDGGIAQTLAEHAASHNFPMHVRHCGACRFWKNREKWSVSCSATNPVTAKKETWLGHAGGGLAVCLFCAAFKGRRCMSALGRGSASCLRLANIHRHAKCKEHQEAEAAWKERVRAEGAMQGVEACSEAATAAAAPPVLRKTVAESFARGVVATRALLETSSSFRSFDVWRDGLLGDRDGAAVGSSWQCRRVVLSMALHEKWVTQKILREGIVFRLSADGVDRTYQVEIGTVLWALPKVLDFSCFLW